MQGTGVLEVSVIFCSLICVLLTANESLIQILLVCVFMLATLIQSLIPPQDISSVTTWKFRQKASTGLVTGSVLLPMAFVAHGADGCANSKGMWACTLPITVLTTSIALLLAVTIGRRVLSGWTRILCSPYLLVVIHIWCYFLLKPYGSYIGVYVICGAVIALIYFSHLMTCLPVSFSLGEALLIVQWLTVLMLDSLTIFPGPVIGSQTFGACLQVLVVGSITAAFFVHPIYSDGFERIFGTPAKDLEKRGLSWSVYFYAVFAAVNLIFLLPWLGILIQENPVLYGLNFMFASYDRIWLMFAWAVLVTIAVSVVSLTPASSTVVRKYFHLIAIATYIPGLAYDPELLCLASAGSFFVFLFLESIRVLRIKPFGSFLHEAFQVFVDERDSGVLTLTHIYLLVGLSLPIWIYSEGHYLKSGLFLPLFSGVLSIGVGDTAASIVGSKFGSIHWPGTKKTVEGTAAAIVSQVVCCHLLETYLKVVPTRGGSMTLLAIILTSLLEAFTDQIDNIILPVFMFALLSCKF